MQQKQNNKTNRKWIKTTLPFLFRRVLGGLLFWLKELNLMTLQYSFGVLLLFINLSPFQINVHIIFEPMWFSALSILD